MRTIKLVRFYFLAIAVNIAAFSFLYLLVPGIREILTQEDRFLENLTALFSLESFLFGMYYLLSLKSKLYRRLYSPLPAFGLVAFLDEVSFGGRWFDVTFPMVGGVRIDGLHDFVSLFYKKSLSLPAAHRYLIAGFLVFFVLGSVSILKKLVDQYQRSVSPVRFGNIFQAYPPLSFVIGSVTFAAIATFLDLHIVDFRGTEFLEELFEMNGAFSLLFACLSIKYSLMTGKIHPA